MPKTYLKHPSYLDDQTQRKKTVHLTFSDVTPANAGAQRLNIAKRWIAAFAGMTKPDESPSSPMSRTRTDRVNRPS